MAPAIPQKFDLAVCYRIYPGVSGRPIFGFKEKYPMLKLNLQSFKQGLGGLKVKIWVLLDSCPPSYTELLKDIFPDTELVLIPLVQAGNGPTFRKQAEILTTQTDADLVYFAEDDYLYLPRSVERTLQFMRRHPEADFATGYDHVELHTKYIHRIRGREAVEDGCRWRTTVSTCLTFMGRRDAVALAMPVINTYNANPDLAMWMSLTKMRVANPWSWFRSLGDGKFFAASHALAWFYGSRQILFGKRFQLWAPTPGLITHMESTGLAPGVDWAALFGDLAKS